MVQRIIRIPTLNDEASDFDQLFNIRNQVGDCAQDLRFDFSGCGFLRPNAVAFLGALARLVESREGNVVFDWDTLHDQAVMTNLCQNGFAGTFGHGSTGWDGNSIPYREHESLDMNGIMDYLTLNWIGKGWVQISHRLRDAIAGTIWEIYSNAFEHSGSPIGVFSCGQHFWKRNELILSVVDLGQGIPAKVRTFLQQHAGEKLVSRLTGASCLKWAFQPGNTTKVGEVGGSGLDLLKEFIRVNQGTLEVYSNESYVIIDKDGERYQNRDISCEGTTVHISLRCDERLYRFRDETNPQS